MADPLRPAHPVQPARPGPPVAVHGLPDLAAVLPYLLGFVPRESVVCLATADGRIVLAGRVDLPDATGPAPAAGRAGPAWPDAERGPALPPALREVVRAFRGVDATRLLAMVVTDRPFAWPEDDRLADRLAAVADAAGLVLADVGLHRADRVRSLLCRDPACCPPGGRPVDPAAAAVAAATVHGVLALPDRAAVAAEFTLPPPADRAAAEPEIAAAENAAMAAVLDGHADAHRTAGVAAVREAARAADRAVARGHCLTPPGRARAARLAVALSDVAVRDELWCDLDAGRLDGQGLWLDLARAVPPPYDAGPLFLAAWRAWRRGDGIRAELGCRAALASQPDYGAARLLAQALDARLDPRRFPPLGAGPTGPRVVP